MRKARPLVEPDQRDERLEVELAQSRLDEARRLYGTVEVRFVTIHTLIAMKEVVGREQDRIDIEHLRMRLEDDDGQRN